jgi:probable HAF family extracellular repeat protein
MVKLPGTEASDIGSSASGVSADGTVIVGTRTPAASTGFGVQAFRWSADRLEMLGDLDGGTVRSLATAVSADGKIVVGYGTTRAGEEAFAWSRAGGIVSIGDLPGGDNGSEIGGDVGSQALGVSATGNFIVGWGTSVSGTEAFRWKRGVGMIGLGDLPGGAFNSVATGIIGSGKVVVGYGTSAAGKEAFFWEEATGRMVTLASVLAAKGVSLTGWKLVSADSISADGKTIVGWGEHDRKAEGFIIRNPSGR